MPNLNKVRGKGLMGLAPYYCYDSHDLQRYTDLLESEEDLKEKQQETRWRISERMKNFNGYLAEIKKTKFYYEGMEEKTDKEKYKLHIALLIDHLKCGRYNLKRDNIQTITRQIKRASMKLKKAQENGELPFIPKKFIIKEYLQNIIFNYLEAGHPLRHTLILAYRTAKKYELLNLCYDLPDYMGDIVAPNFVSYCLLHYTLNLQYLISFLKNRLINAENHEIIKEHYIEQLKNMACKFPELINEIEDLGNI